MRDRQADAVARLNAGIKRRAASDIERMIMRVIVRIVALMCLAAWLADHFDRR